MRHAIFTILALSFLLVACGGTPSASTDTTAPESAPDDTAAPETNTEPSNDGEDATKEFERAISGYMDAQFSVDYTMTTTGDGETFTGTMSQYFGGPERMRTDSSAMGVNSRMYILGEEFITCYTYDGEWQCNKLPESEESDETETTSDLSDYATEEGEEVEYTVTSDGTMRIAGVTAQCYKIAEPESSARYCIYDNVPLYISTEYEDGSSELIATRYKKGVSSSDFVPPAEPTEGFPGMGGGAAGTFPEDYEMPDGFDPEAYAYQ